jgi:hypothetical protein
MEENAQVRDDPCARLDRLQCIAAPLAVTTISVLSIRNLKREGNELIIHPERIDCHFPRVIPRRVAGEVVGESVRR